MVRASIWVCGTTVAALTVGLLGGLVTLPVGLILDDRLSWGLVLGVAALFAALGGTWVGSVLGLEGAAVRLGPVLATTEGAALALWLVRLSPLGTRLARALETNLAYVAACVLVLALIAVLAAVQFRGSRRDLRRLRRATFGLVGSVILGVPAVVYVASLFGLVGA